MVFDPSKIGKLRYSFFNDDTWLMIRPSGTEPVLRTYSEAPTREIALKILESAQSEIL